MATKIVTKNSSTASAAPTASDLVQGELAVNVTDKRLYTEDNAGNIVELGTNPLGEITANGGIALGDNDKATFGASDDLQIYHDGNNSYIDDAGTGNLRIRGNQVILEKYTGETILQGIADGSVYIFHDNAEKLATNSSGISVTGVVAADSLTVDNFTLNGTTLALSSGDMTLDVAGTITLDADNTGTIYLSDGGTNYGLFFQDSNRFFIQSQVSDADMLFRGSDAGTVFTALSLDMSEAGAATFNAGITVGGVLELQANNSGFPTTGMVLNQNNFVYLRGGSNGLIIGKAGDNEAMRIDPSGRVLVGITGASGYGMLESIDLAVTGQCILARASGSVLVGTTSAYNYSGIAPLLTIDNHAGIGIRNVGSADAGYSTIPSGNHNYYAGYFLNSSGSGVGNISCTSSSTAYNTSSDYRLKENVVPMTGSIDRVKALKPSQFNFITDADTTVDGFLAHEAQAVVPECVTGSKDAMRDEEYEVTAAVYEDVITPAFEAVEGVEAIEAVEAVDAVYDDKGVIVSEAIEAVEAVEGVEAVEAVAETTESVLTTEAVMGTRSVPDMQGIDQAKLVPLLTAALQEAITKIESLTSRIEALEAV